MHKSSEKSCIQILDEVSEVLAHFRLKLAENVWASDVPIKSEKFLQSRAEFDNGCKLLWTLKDLVNVIGPMYRCLNTKLKKMSREIDTALIRASYHYGLESLPHECFMRIMGLLAATCTTYTDRMRLVKNLSSVSRRFRDGVVNTTSFWVYWDTQYCLDGGFEHRLVRTKEAPLFIDLDLEWGDQEEIFTRILPHRTRWHRVRLFLSNAGELGELGSKFPMVDFPSVRSLVINTRDPSGDTFFAEWTFLNVSSVELWNVIAPPGAFPKATSLTLRGRPFLEDNAQYLPKLTTLLCSMPALTTLDLDVTHKATIESLTVELPNITTFSIANRYGRNDPASLECIGQLTRALKLPNVENIMLRLYLEGKEGKDWVSKVFNEGVPFRSVKHFRLTVMSVTTKIPTPLFDGFSSRFPNLNSLRVDGIGGQRYGAFSLAESFDMLEGRLPHLHSLTVLHMDNDWFRFCEWFTSLSEKGAVIHHLSVSQVDEIGIPQDLYDMLKQNNADIELKVLPYTPYGNK